MFHLNLNSDFYVSKEREKEERKTIFRKHCHCSSTFIYPSTLSKLPINVKYDNILNNFEFVASRAKVKVTLAIFRKTLSLL